MRLKYINNDTKGLLHALTPADLDLQRGRQFGITSTLQNPNQEIKLSVLPTLADLLNYDRKYLLGLLERRVGNSGLQKSQGIKIEDIVL